MISIVLSCGKMLKKIKSRHVKAIILLFYIYKYVYTVYTSKYMCIIYIYIYILRILGVYIYLCLFVFCFADFNRKFAARPAPPLPPTSACSVTKTKKQKNTNEKKTQLGVRSRRSGSWWRDSGMLSSLPPRARRSGFLVRRRFQRGEASHRASDKTAVGGADRSAPSRATDEDLGAKES